ncbi:flagellar basal body-associated FliL family protein [Undibacterium sp. Di27W]|uniref:flagellar basal body-associated FliL family protein n=1 Tax=Undibacterium sp. Di27W TaxID=3413036 RepID=UPI003BF3842B
MSKDRSKASILSAQLDFEAIDGSAPQKSASALDFEADEPEAAAAPVPKATPVRSPPPVQVPKKPALEKKPNKKKNAGNDRFGVYAAVIVLVVFSILLAIFFYIRSVNSNAAGLSYFVLPQQVANLNGQVVRMQVTIQVRTEDSDWLFENKKLLANLFQIEFAKIDPDDLHSEEGFDTVRAQLKSGLNQALQTDKIESVLINELLMQNRE